MQRKTKAPSALAVLLMTAWSLSAMPVLAQGFGVYEQGTCAMSRAGATVADVCDDATGVFFNPAGLAGQAGATATLGGTAIVVRGDFTDDRTGRTTDLANDPVVVPHLYVSYGLGERLALALGAYVPYGLGTVWPEGFEGRFLGYDNNLQSIYVQPTLAYRLSDRLALGAGLTVVLGSVTLNQRLDLSRQLVPTSLLPDPSLLPEGTRLSQLGVPYGTDFADAHLDGSGTGFGANLGLTFQATEALRLGARFMTPVTISYEGDATFEPVSTGIVLPGGNLFGLPAGTPLDLLLQAGGLFTGTLAPQGIETEITMPAQAVVGLSLQATDQLTLLADYQWTGWSAFDEIVLTFERAPEDVQVENYEDTHALRLGLDYALNTAWTFRTGFLTHSAAAPDETVTPLLPEGYRNEVTVGLGWQPARAFALNVAYQYLNQNDRRGRVRGPQPEERPTADLNSGLYSFVGHLFGATLTVHF